MHFERRRLRTRARAALSGLTNSDMQGKVTMNWLEVQGRRDETDQVRRFGAPRLSRGTGVRTVGSLLLAHTVGRRLHVTAAVEGKAAAARTSRRRRE